MQWDFFQTMKNNSSSYLMNTLDLWGKGDHFPRSACSIKKTGCIIFMNTIKIRASLFGTLIQQRAFYWGSTFGFWVFDVSAEILRNSNSFIRQISVQLLRARSDCKYTKQTSGTTMAHRSKHHMRPSGMCCWEKLNTEVRHLQEAKLIEENTWALT